jgi:hypothetical protein
MSSDWLSDLVSRAKAAENNRLTMKASSQSLCLSGMSLHVTSPYHGRRAGDSAVLTHRFGQTSVVRHAWMALTRKMPLAFLADCTHLKSYAHRPARLQIHLNVSCIFRKLALGTMSLRLATIPLFVTHLKRFFGQEGSRLNRPAIRFELFRTWLLRGMTAFSSLVGFPELCHRRPADG